MNQVAETKPFINFSLILPKPIFVFFSYDGHGLPIAFRLQQEGYKVYVGMVKELKEIKETEKEKEARLSLYDGLLEKIDADKLLKALSFVKDKSRYFIVCDFSFLYEYGEELKKLGFMGLLPSKQDWELEEERELAQNLVEERYRIFSPKEHYEFSKIDEVEKFLEGTDKVWVLKGNYAEAPTVVPVSNDPDIAKIEILDALRVYQKEYEREGFSLQEKLTDILEFVPEAISFDGIVRGINIDLEIKNFAPGNFGYGGQTGCSVSTIFWLTKKEGEVIYDDFLKPLEKEMLRKNELTIWDAGTIYDKKKKGFFFTEFCIRWGYDAVFDELATLPSAGYYFEKILRGEDIYNPQECSRFGASFRIFVVPEFGVPREKIKSEKIILLNGFDKDIWLWDVKKTSEGLETANFDANVMVITGKGDTMEEALTNAFENIKKVVFGGYHWQLENVLYEGWKNNLPERLKFLK